MWKCQQVGPRAGGSALELPVLHGGLPKAYVFKTANNQETIVHSNLSGNIFVCVCVCVCMCWHPIWQWLLSTSGRPVPFSQLESPPPHKDPEEG